MAAVSSFSTKEKREEGARSVKLVDLVFFFRVCLGKNTCIVPKP